MEAQTISKKASNVFSDLMIPFTLQRMTIPISVSDKQSDSHFLYAYIIKFNYKKDMMYLLWILLDNVSEDFFSEKFTIYLNKILYGKTQTNELYIIEEGDINKFFEKIEELKSTDTVNQWQSSRQAIEAFNQMDDTLISDIEWIKKYHAIRHFDIWSSEKVIELVTHLVDTLTFNLHVQAEAIFKPIEYPYMLMITFPEANAAISLFKKMRMHSKFKDFHETYIMSFEDLSTSTVEKGQGFMVRLNYETVELFSEIVNDLI